jgi:hypothetical protein
MGTSAVQPTTDTSVVAAQPQENVGTARTPTTATLGKAAHETITPRFILEYSRWWYFLWRLLYLRVSRDTIRYTTTKTKTRSQKRLRYPTSPFRTTEVPQRCERKFAKTLFRKQNSVGYLEVFKILSQVLEKGNKLREVFFKILLSLGWIYIGNNSDVSKY